MVLWIRYILGFVLLPFVLVLGVRVRRTILRLPEAEGERHGVIGEGNSEIGLFCLGESPIAGVGLDNQTENLTPILAKHIHEMTKKTVCWDVFGKTGIRMAELLPTFGNDFPTKADIVFIGMGVNDCKEGTSMSKWRIQWLRLHTYLRQLYPDALIVCSSAPPLRSFPALPFPIRLFLGYRSDLMNEILRVALMPLDNKTMYLPLPNILAPGYFAIDGFHPNAQAHKEWGKGIFDAIVAGGYPKRNQE